MAQNLETPPCSHYTTVTSRGAVCGASPQDWENLAVWAGLQQDLLPVVSNTTAKISPNSSMASLGKTPSEYNMQGLARGFVNWTQHHASAVEVARWEKQPDYGICLQTRRVRAIDVDVDDPVLAAAIRKVIAPLVATNSVTGLLVELVAPVRSRSNSGKFLMAIRVAPGLALPKRKMIVEGGIIEFLATGQQFIAAGQHPSGARYVWDTEDGHAPQDIPEISLEQMEILWTALADAFATEAPTEEGTAGERQRGATIAMDDPLADHLYDQGLVLGTAKGDGLNVTCPWEGEHTSGTDGDGSTTYFPAGTKGYAHGAYKCLHGHCAGRTTRQFARMVGFFEARDPDADFGQFVDEPTVEDAVITKVYIPMEVIEADEAHMEELRNHIMDAKTVASIEREIAPAIAKSARYRDSDRERIAVWMQKRTGQIESKALPLGIVRSWVAPVGELIHLQLTFPDVNVRGARLATIDNVIALCQKLSTGIVYNVISKRQEIRAPDLTCTRDNHENEALAWLYSACQKEELPIAMQVLKAYVTKIAGGNQVNPVAAWITVRPWDGVDRLHNLYATIGHNPEFDVALKEMMVRKWLIQAVAAACCTTPIQTRGVLVVQGDQNIGKSRWLQSLCPGHSDLVITGRTVDPHNKDSVKTAISHWLCEFGELDATFKKSDIAAIKAFMSQDMDTMRLPYALSDSSFQRRTVFFGSVNTERFLADDTGNTRFWVVPVLSMDAQHGLDMQQVWAQVHSLWVAGEEHWFSQEQMALVNQSSEEFRIADPTLEALESVLNLTEALANPLKFVWQWMSSFDVNRLLSDAPPGARITTNGIGKALGKMAKAGTIKSKKTNGTTNYYVPVGVADKDIV